MDLYNYCAWSLYIYLNVLVVANPLNELAAEMVYAPKFSTNKTSPIANSGNIMSSLIKSIPSQVNPYARDFLSPSVRSLNGNKMG